MSDSSFGDPTSITQDISGQRIDRLVRVRFTEADVLEIIGKLAARGALSDGFAHAVLDLLEEDECDATQTNRVAGVLDRCDQVKAMEVEEALGEGAHTETVRP